VGGKVFVNVTNNETVSREDADIEELKMINTAITRQGFEDKLFYHSVNRKDKSISLYIPFVYGVEHTAVATIKIVMIDIDRQMNLLYRQCLLIGVLVVLFHLIFAMLYSKMILFPIRKLNELHIRLHRDNWNPYPYRT
jgi:hypothetical protein